MHEQKNGKYLSLDEIHFSSASYDFADEIIAGEVYEKLKNEIAFLSRTQREIVMMFYYDRLKQNQIAKQTGLPIGTVKWHLFESRNSLKEGMNMKREKGLLGIRPVKFNSMGHCGCSGSLGDTSDFLRKTLSQNIAYAAYHEPKTINEIAKELGVSPVFIEDEVDYLVEYGFIDKVDSNSYLTNIFLTEVTHNVVEKEHELTKKYAGILVDKYILLVIEAIKAPDLSQIYFPYNDFNFLLWSTITHALSYKLAIGNLWDESDQFMVRRKDGGNYIAWANVETDISPSYNPELYDFCGNMTRGSSKYSISAWQIDSYYDSRTGRWRDNLSTDYEYLFEAFTGKLTKDETNIDKYKRIFDKGYLISDSDKDVVNMVVIRSKELFENSLPGISDELKAIGNEYDDEIFNLKKTLYPKHMQALCRAWSRNCLCQGSTLTRVLEILVERKILALPSEIQKHGLNTILFSDILPLP